LRLLDDADVVAGGEAGSGANQAVDVKHALTATAHEVVMPLPTRLV
jgi:hypothetical protein